MDENSGSSTATRVRGRKERKEGGERRLQSIFIIYLRVSSDWLLPDLCPMARANSRAIAHGYRLSSTESTTESRISSWVSYPPNPPLRSRLFFSSRSRRTTTTHRRKRRIASRDLKRENLRSRCARDFRRYKQQSLKFINCRQCQKQK